MPSNAKCSQEGLCLRPLFSSMTQFHWFISARLAPAPNARRLHITCSFVYIWCLLRQNRMHLTRASCKHLPVDSSVPHKQLLRRPTLASFRCTRWQRTGAFRKIRMLYRKNSEIFVICLWASNEASAKARWSDALATGCMNEPGRISPACLRMC